MYAKFFVKRPYTLDLVLKEVANALWKRVLLSRDIGADKALELLNDLIEMKRAVLRVELRIGTFAKALG